MKRGKWVLFIILAGAIISFVTPGFSQTKETQHISISTHAVGSFYSIIGAGLSDIINRHTDLRCRVKPLAGPTAWLPMLESKEVTFGLINTRDAFLAYQGTAIYKDQSQGKGFRFMRLVMVGSSNNYGLLMRANSGIKTLADFKGKRTASGYHAHWINQDFLEAMCENIGVSVKDLKRVMVSTYPEGVGALKEDRVDMCIGSIGSGVVQEANAMISGGVMFFPMNGSPEGKKIVRDNHPGVYISLLEDDVVGAKKGTYVLTADVSMVTGSNISEEIVYKVTKAIYENYKELHKIHPDLKTWIPERMVSESPSFNYHEGAIRLYKEKGIWKK